MAQTQEPDDQTAALALQLSRRMLKTVTAYRLIEEGDRILVAVSGGKDSYSLLDLLWQAQRKAPVRFELLAVHLDQRQPGHDFRPLEEWLESLGVPFKIVREDTYSVVMADAEQNPKATYCRICSRLRRGILYKAAEQEGCNKIALGHHRDDSLETLLMNLFYSGRLQAMPPMYTTNDEKYKVIRPLIECGEREIAALASAAGYPILPCNLCGSLTDPKRVQTARLLSELELENPQIRQVMLAALKNVRPSHLLDPEVAEAWASQADKYTPRR
jgi:tRNA 2-thiocytidine biosynthesis protein TtcA